LPLTGGTLTGGVTINQTFNDPDYGDYVKTATLSPYGFNISYNLNNDDHGFNANEYGISFGYTDNPLYINLDRIERKESQNVVWGIGYRGVTFPDGTIQTTAGLGIDSSEGGLNFEATGIWGGYRVYQFLDDGDGEYKAIGQLNCFGLNFVSEGNPNGDWHYGIFQDGIYFNDGTIQTTASTNTFNPVIQNSGLSQSGNIAHSDYPKEIQLVIDGVTYAIPARII